MGTKFGRRTHKCRGVRIFLHDNMHCTNINMDRHSNKKETEICAVKLHILTRNIIIITIYRFPTVNITYILNNLEAALNQGYNNTVDIILCGDFNALASAHPTDLSLVPGKFQLGLITAEVGSPLDLRAQHKSCQRWALKSISTSCRINWFSSCRMGLSQMCFL